MGKLVRFFTAIVIIAIITAPAISQMTVDRVLDNMRAQYEKSIQNIEDYTVVTNIYTAYHKKTYVDGKPVFKTHTEIRGMEEMGGLSSSSVSQAELFDAETYEILRKNARYEGTERINGIQTHVLFIPRLEVEQEDAHPENVRMYVDGDKWVVRKMTFEQVHEQQKFTGVVTFEDYRGVHGMLLPYRTKMVFEGLDEAISPEEREEARRSLKEFEEQLKQMPDAQRQMMERMMRPQMEQLQKMLEGEGMEFIVEIEEVEVNTGLPDEMFK